jgi:hypothetical protein
MKWSPDMSLVLVVCVHDPRITLEPSIFFTFFSIRITFFCILTVPTFLGRVNCFFCNLNVFVLRHFVIYFNLS